MGESSSEVKGIWFSSLRSYLSETRGPESIAKLVEALPGDHGAAVADPMVSAWYPEDTLSLTLEHTYEVIAGGDGEAFEALIRGVTVQGVGRFFRVLLHFTSPAFVVRKIPVVWSRLRRGAGEVTVERTPRGALVRYRSFPYFEQRTYRIMTTGAIRGMLEACGAKAPRIAIVARTRDSLDVEVET